MKNLKVHGTHPDNFSLKDKAQKNSLRLASWNQPDNDPEIEDLFSDSHSQINLIYKDSYHDKYIRLDFSYR
jgi:hypothetical protein